MLSTGLGSCVAGGEKLSVVLTVGGFVDELDGAVSPARLWAVRCRQRVDVWPVRGRAALWLLWAGSTVRGLCRPLPAGIVLRLGNLCRSCERAAGLSRAPAWPAVGAAAAGYRRREGVKDINTVRFEGDARLR
jgi:hypothetical protein